MFVKRKGKCDYSDVPDSLQPRGPWHQAPSMHETPQAEYWMIYQYFLLQRMFLQESEPGLIAEQVLYHQSLGTKSGCFLFLVWEDTEVGKKRREFIFHVSLSSLLGN